MKKINISITKQEIFHEVSLNTAYTSVKSDNPKAIFPRVATIDEDSTILSRFWILACGTITEKFRNLITVSSTTGDNLALTLDVSGSFDDSLTESLKQDIFDALVAMVTAHWITLSLPEKSSEWQLQGSRLLESAYSKLYCRKRPTRNKLN